MKERFLMKGLLGVLIFALTISLMTSLAHSKKALFNGHEYKEGEILVRFKPTTTSTRINAVTKSIKAQVLHSSGAGAGPMAIIPNLYLLKIDNTNITQSLGMLASNPDVEYAEPNYKLYALRTPNDPYFMDQWDLENIGQSGGTTDADIDAPQAWDLQTGSRSVVVAVVDTGVDYNHTDLAGNIWINQGEIPGNGLDDDNNGYVDDIHGINVVNYYSGGAPTAGDPMDDLGHGTHVAGIIGASGDNGRGTSGVNWKVSIMPLKFINSEGSGWLEDAVLCLQYILNQKRAGVNIVAANASWGGGGYSRALYDAIKALQDEGVLFIAAAGNDGMDNDSYLTYPASYDLMSIISVAATDHNDNLAWFSNFGKRTIDVAAPGDGILSTCSPFLPMCWSTDAYPYDIWLGTSMATP
ncbi:MAG: S8 family serine peptidase, partial [bacterium]